MKGRVRSQLAVGEMTLRAGRLAQSLGYIDIWMKRNMILEERHRKRKKN